MPRPPAPVAMTTVADGAVLLDEATGTFYHLNQTGALVYALLRTGAHTVDEAARTLASAFATDEALARSDVEAFLKDLAHNRLASP